MGKIVGITYSKPAPVPQPAQPAQPKPKDKGEDK